jgi:PadR family transcriptional regulator PadR
MEVSKVMIKRYIESIILSLLVDEDLYIQDISRRIRTTSESNFEISEGTMDVVLRRLEVNGCVECYWNDLISDGERRRYHHITNKGKKYLANTKEQWEFFKFILDKFLKKDLEE